MKHHLLRGGRRNESPPRVSAYFTPSFSHGTDAIIAFS